MATYKESLLEVLVDTAEFVSNLEATNKREVKAQETVVAMLQKRINTLNKQLDKYFEKQKQPENG